MLRPHEARSIRRLPENSSRIEAVMCMCMTLWQKRDGHNNPFAMEPRAEGNAACKELLSPVALLQRGSVASH